MILHQNRYALVRDDDATNRWLTDMVDDEGRPAAMPWFDKLEGRGDYDRPYYGRVAMVGIGADGGELARPGDMVVTSLMSVGYRDTISGQRLTTLQTPSACAVLDTETGRARALGKWIVCRSNPALAAQLTRAPGGRIWMPDSNIVQDDAPDRRRSGLTVAYAEVLDVGGDCPDMPAGTLIQYDETASTVELMRRGRPLIAVNYSQVIYSWEPQWLADHGWQRSSEEELEAANRYPVLDQSA